MIASKCRVLRPAAVVKPLPCIGSQTQTTGWPASVTARSSGGRSEPTRSAPSRAIKRQPPGNAVRVQPLAELDDLVRASQSGPSLQPIGL